MICLIDAHDENNPTENYDDSSGGGIPLPYYSSVHMFVLLGITLNFVESLLQSFNTNYLSRKTMYGEKMIELFKNPVDIS